MTQICRAALLQANCKIALAIPSTCEEPHVRGEPRVTDHVSCSRFVETVGAANDADAGGVPNPPLMKVEVPRAREVPHE